MRICIVYDCIYPHTVGGAERWYRELAERLAADGHEVDYLTLRQWPDGEDAGVPGVRVVAVGPRMALYVNGRRRIVPPLRFALGVFTHLALRRGRYDVVRVMSFPYFPLLAAGALRPLRRYRLVVDWFELWSRAYWREYLGAWPGEVGWRIQRLCLRVPQRAFCFSRLHERRLRDEGLRGELTVLRGLYAGPVGVLSPAADPPVVVYAGRHIPEKRVPSIVLALQRARTTLPALKGEIYGDGPARPEVLRLVSELGLVEAIEVPGFVSQERIEQALAGALCLVLPSSREGYGLVVVEAASYGTPSVVVAGPDNAAVELIVEGINGTVIPSSSPGDIAAAIMRVHGAGHALRESTAAWFARERDDLSLAGSLDRMAAAHASPWTHGRAEPADAPEDHARA
jgi:glycosyltransferase involved in cell wall biosynthesis